MGKFYCGNKDCNTISDPINIPAHGHIFSNQDNSARVPGTWVDATCTESAKFKVYCVNYDNRNNRRCDAQSELISYGEPLGHKFAATNDGSNYCQKCTRENCTAFEGHVYGYVENKPTCQNDGARMNKCKNTGCTSEVDIQIIPKTGHKAVEGSKTQTNPPTCTYVGKYRYQCEFCKTYYWEDGTETLPHDYVNGKCTVCHCEEAMQTVQGITQFDANGTTVADIQLNTFADSFATGIRNQNENAQVKLYNANNVFIEENEKLATGMKMEVTKGEETYSVTLVIKGDVDGNGEQGFTDITKANKQRLNKEKLGAPYFRAADVNKDGKVDFKDLVILNKLRLGKTTEL